MNPLKYLTTFFVTLFAISAQGQDSVKTLSARQVLHIVKENHPIIKQASILIKKAQADVTIARAGFDPLLSNSLAQKTFEGTDYYKYNRPELSIPTWFGIEFIAGREKLSGNRTDPQETLGNTNFIGFSIPLAKNLLMDNRRAALQTAKIFRQASEIERRNIVNNLLFDVLKTYGYWMQHYLMYEILTEAVKVNEKRFGLVKVGYQLGERPAIDTTEALAQLQNFQGLKEIAFMQFQNAGLDLSVFLWNENDQPFSLPVDVLPAHANSLEDVTKAPIPNLEKLLKEANKNHPELSIYDFKMDALVINRKLKFQELLPVVNFRYNQLGKGYNIVKTATGPLFENNFKYGFTFGIPLRISEGRGEYQKAKLKIIETQLEQTRKQAEVENKVKSYFNELVALQKQVVVQEKAYSNFLMLQRGEEIRFRIGESSLFLINARENKTLEALQKLQELRVKFFITVNALQWAAGSLAE